jgi:hypothetical protein
MTLYVNGPVGGYIGWTNGEGFIDFHKVGGGADRWHAADDSVVSL